MKRSGQRCRQKKSKGNKKGRDDMDDLKSTYACLHPGSSERDVLIIQLDCIKSIIESIQRQNVHNSVDNSWIKQLQQQNQFLTAIYDKLITKTEKSKGGEKLIEIDVDYVFCKAYILYLRASSKMLLKENFNVVSGFIAVRECFEDLGDEYLLIKFDIELLVGKAYLMQKDLDDPEGDLKQNIIQSKELYDKCRAKTDLLEDPKTSTFYTKYYQTFRENLNAKSTDTNQDLLNLMHIELIRNYHQYYKLINHSKKALHYGILALKYDLHYNRFDVKEWIDKTISLSFYAVSDMYAFAQSYYLLRVCTMFLEREEKNAELPDDNIGEMENPIQKLRDLRGKVAKAYVEHIFYIHFFMEMHESELKRIPEGASEEFIQRHLIKPCGIFTNVVEFENLPGEVPPRDPDLERVPINTESKNKMYSVMEEYKREVFGLQNNPNMKMLRMKCGCCI